MSQDKIQCEKRTYLQKVKEIYQENSMLMKFYAFLKRKLKGGKEYGKNKTHKHFFCNFIRLNFLF